MREFKALNPTNLPDGFDIEVHSEEPVVEVEESERRIVISYNFPGFYLVDDNREVAGREMTLKRLFIKSTGYLAESGKPLLPSFGRYVQIPPHCDFKIRVQKTQPIQFDDIQVSSAQTRLSDNPDQKHEYEYDYKFYAMDEPYPKDIVKVTGPFSVDQHCVLLVHVIPLQYNPAMKKILGHGNITVTIELKNNNGTARATDAFDGNKAIGNLLLNPEQTFAEKVGLAIPSGLYRAKGPELLIIYAKLFEKAAKRLADWKNHRGLVTETVCIDKIGNTVDSLKKYLRGRRKKLFSPLRYVLIFGDADMIVTQTDLPTIFGAAGFPAHLQPVSNTATDYYYSTQYDENNPDPANPNSILFYPWLSVGRIPVRPDIEGPPASGDSQAQGVVDQIIGYEKNPPADSMYYKRQVFAAAFEDDSWPIDHRDDRGYLRTIEEIRAAVASLGYSTERVYVSNDPQLDKYDDGTSIPADVKSAIVNSATATQMLVDATKEGQLFIGHRDHGNWDGWVNPSFRNSDLDNVSGDMPSLFYSINCETGGLDYPEPTECFAEKNLRMKGTAPSLIAATRDSGTYRNNDLIRAIFDATFGGILPTFPGGNASYPLRNNRLGDILNYGKSYLPVSNIGDDHGIKDHFEIYHIIGDPTLELWKELPRMVAIKSRIIKNALSIQLSTCPNGAVLTIWYGSKMLKRIAPNSNHITIPLGGVVPIPFPKAYPRKALMVCFWAPGYRYTQNRVSLP